MPRAARPGRAGVRAPPARSGHHGDRLAPPRVARGVHVLRLARMGTDGKARGPSTRPSAGLACEPRCPSTASASSAAARCASTSATGAIPSAPPLVSCTGCAITRTPSTISPAGSSIASTSWPSTCAATATARRRPTTASGTSSSTSTTWCARSGSQKPVLIGHSLGGEVVGQLRGCFPDVPRRGHHRGPRPAAARHGREVRWTDRRLRAHRPRPRRASRAEGSRRRLQAPARAQPAPARGKARELALLGTRAREDGTLEWKFDAMLTTMAVTGPFHLEYAMAFWRRVTAPTLIVHGGESGEFWREQPGAIYLEPDDLAPAPRLLPRPPLRRDPRRRAHGALRSAARAGDRHPRVPAGGGGLRAAAGLGTGPRGPSRSFRWRCWPCALMRGDDRRSRP